MECLLLAVLFAAHLIALAVAEEFAHQRIPHAVGEVGEGEIGFRHIQHVVLGLSLYGPVVLLVLHLPHPTITSACQRQKWDHLHPSNGYMYSREPREDFFAIWIYVVRGSAAATWC